MKASTWGRGRGFEVLNFEAVEKADKLNPLRTFSHTNWNRKKY